MKLNLGCGDRYAEGWTNVDWDTPHRIDQRVDLAGELPWPPGSVTRVYAGHLLEHLSYDSCLDLLMRLLVCADPRGCTLVAVGPDVDVAEQMVRDGTFDSTYHSLETLKHGAGRWAGDVHLWETTGPLVADLVRRAGWPIVHLMNTQQLEGGWPVVERQWEWQYAVRAWIGEVK